MFQSMGEKPGGTSLCSELDCANLKRSGEIGALENIHLFAGEGHRCF